MASKLVSEISGYAEIMENLEWEAEIAEMSLHDCEQDIQRDPKYVLTRDKERFYREAEEGLVRHKKEKEYWTAALNQLKSYEVTDCDVESDIDRQLKALMAADEPPEGSDWADEVSRIKKQKSTDTWLYKVPRKAKVIIVCDIETGEMAVRDAKNYKSMACMPHWKYQVIA